MNRSLWCSEDYVNAIQLYISSQKQRYALMLRALSCKKRSDVYIRLINLKDCWAAADTFDYEYSSLHFTTVVKNLTENVLTLFFTMCLTFSMTISYECFHFLLCIIKNSVWFELKVIINVIINLVTNMWNHQCCSRLTGMIY